MRGGRRPRIDGRERPKRNHVALGRERRGETESRPEMPEAQGTILQWGRDSSGSGGSCLDEVANFFGYLPQPPQATAPGKTERDVPAPLCADCLPIQRSRDAAIFDVPGRRGQPQGILLGERPRPPGRVCFSAASAMCGAGRSRAARVFRPAEARKLNGYECGRLGVRGAKRTSPSGTIIV